MRQTKKTQKINASLFFYIIMMPFVFVLCYLLSTYNNEFNNQPLLFGFLILYAFTVIHAIYTFEIISIYTLFLYFSAFFLYDCFFFTLFREYNFLVLGFPKLLVFKETTGLVFVCICYLFVYVVHIFVTIMYLKSNHNAVLISYTQNKNAEKIGVSIMMLFVFPTTMKFIMQLRYVMSHGYTAIFTGNGLDKIHYPFWMTGSFIFFSIGYFVFLAAYPRKKKYLLFTVVFLILQLLNSMKGQRAAFLASIFLTVVWYKKMYNVKIRIKNLIVISMFCLAFAIIIGNARAMYGNKANQSNNTVSIDKVIEYFLYGQTTSRAVPLLIIEGNLDYHTYPFIFSPLLGPMYPLLNRMGTNNLNNDISAVTMSNVSEQAFKDGSGYGGAVIAEFYDCGGIFGIIFYSGVLAFMFILFESGKITNGTRYLVPVLYLLSLNLLTVPRGRFFGFVDYYKIIPAMFLILIIPNLKYLKNKAT